MCPQKEAYDFSVLLLPLAGALGGVFVTGWFGSKSEIIDMPSQLAIGCFDRRNDLLNS